MKCTDAFEYDQEFEIFKISKVKKRSVFFRWKLELLIYIASRLKIIIGLPFKIIKLF